VQGSSLEAHEAGLNDAWDSDDSEYSEYRESSAPFAYSRPGHADSSASESVSEVEGPREREGASISDDGVTLFRQQGALSKPHSSKKNARMHHPLQHHPLQLLLHCDQSNLALEANLLHNNTSPQTSFGGPIPSLLHSMHSSHPGESGNLAQATHLNVADAPGLIARPATDGSKSSIKASIMHALKRRVAQSQMLKSCTIPPPTLLPRPPHLSESTEHLLQSVPTQISVVGDIASALPPTRLPQHTSISAAATHALHEKLRNGDVLKKVWRKFEACNVQHHWKSKCHYPTARYDEQSFYYFFQPEKQRSSCILNLKSLPTLLLLLTVHMHTPTYQLYINTCIHINIYIYIYIYTDMYTYI